MLSSEPPAMGHAVSTFETPGFGLSLGRFLSVNLTDSGSAAASVTEN